MSPYITSSAETIRIYLECPYMLKAKSSLHNHLYLSKSCVGTYITIYLITQTIQIEQYFYFVIGFFSFLALKAFYLGIIFLFRKCLYTNFVKKYNIIWSIHFIFGLNCYGISFWELSLWYKGSHIWGVEYRHHLIRSGQLISCLISLIFWAILYQKKAGLGVVKQIPRMYAIIIQLFLWVELSAARCSWYWYKPWNLFFHSYRRKQMKILKSENETFANV